MDLSSSETRRRNRQFRRWFAAALGVSAVCGLVLVSSASGDAADHKVTLCHATNSATTPYVSVTVDYHSVLGEGHGSHDGPVFDPFAPQGKWGDIIPSFDYGPDATYAGMNLSGVGQNILTNGCATTTTTSQPGG